MGGAYELDGGHQVPGGDVTAAPEPVMVKVHVTLGDAGPSGESLWARVLLDGPSGRYEVASIPFLATEVSLGDVVEAHLDPDVGLEFDRVVHESDQMTVSVLLAEGCSTLTDEMVATLDRGGVRFERARRGGYALSVASRNYAGLIDQLQRWRHQGLVEVHSHQ